MQNIYKKKNENKKNDEEIEKKQKVKELEGKKWRKAKWKIDENIEILKSRKTGESIKIRKGRIIKKN